MLSSPFFRRLFLPSLVLIGVTTAIVGFVGARRTREAYLQTSQSRLHDSAFVIGQYLRPLVVEKKLAELGQRVKELGQATGCRVTIIAADDGRVLADSETNPGTMEPHNNRPEVVQASAAGEGSEVRTSGTLHRDLLYLARRFEDGPSRWYVRLALDVHELRTHLWALYMQLAIGSLITMAGAGALAWYFARRQTQPVAELTGFAHALSEGQTQRRDFRVERGELGQLASSLNTVAESLSTVRAEADRDRAELLTILESMSEGVIATDKQQRIVLVNNAAGHLLSFEPKDARGKLLCEVLLNEKILRAATDVLASPGRRTFQLGPIGGRHLEVTVCLYPLNGPAAGVMLLAHDTTQSVRYQELRKEFVANVSHELRTPLTVIKGFVETLLDGAIEDRDAARKYLATIERHSSQLTNLVNDLLEISRLESLPELPRRSTVDLGAIAKKAAELLSPAAQAKNHTLTIAASSNLPLVVGNSDYLERAVANLVDNAVKYTPDGGRIAIGVKADQTHAIVEVTDNGIGIPDDDIGRIFERFYRVDRSRSREMGGTGLGLSIVKHIAQSHGGTVEVASAPGEGSTFRLKLPLPNPS